MSAGDLPPDRAANEPLGPEGAGGTALVQGLRDALQRLLDEDEPSQIDLATLHLDAGARRRLRQLLGQGGVSARIEALGETRIDETATPGLWWITHYNAGGEVVAEFIDVSFCPLILVRDPGEVRAGLARWMLAPVTAHPEAGPGGDAQTP